MTFYDKIMIMTLADLHTHSNASDGDYSPAGLMREAEKRGLSAIALTDHDTLGGLESAKNEAGAIGIHFIPGIEININWKGDRVIPGPGRGGEFHLLGLGIKNPSPDFLTAIAELSRRRQERNLEMLDRMNKLNMPASWDELLAIAGNVPLESASIGRPHFAGLMVKKKFVRNREQAFTRYLKPGRPLFVPKVGLDFSVAAALICESGGIPVLAHPMSLYIAWGSLPEFIRALKDRGLKGIEAWHPTAGAKACRRLENLAKKLGLYITEGSDFHGKTQSDRRLGRSHRGREINAAILEAIPGL